MPDDRPDRPTDPAEHPDGDAARTHRGIAEAFSGHRFRETYEHLAADVAWVAVGAATTRGKDAVVAVCEDTLAELAGTSTEILRFVSVADAARAVVDCVGRYTDPDGGTSAVASCDLYEFQDGQVSRITSYTVEVDPSGEVAGEW